MSNRTIIRIVLSMYAFLIAAQALETHGLRVPASASLGIAACLGFFIMLLAITDA